jgi:hypothetical protein
MDPIGGKWKPRRSPKEPTRGDGVLTAHTENDDFEVCFRLCTVQYNAALQYYRIGKPRHHNPTAIATPPTSPTQSIFQQE